MFLRVLHEKKLKTSKIKLSFVRRIDVVVVLFMNSKLHYLNGCKKYYKTNKELTAKKTSN